MKVSSKSICLIAGFIVTVSCVGDAAAAEKSLDAFPHPVWDSKLYPERRTIFYWVDDNTLLFAAGSGPKPRNLDEARQQKTYLYLWRLGEAPKPYGADPVAASLTYCAANGVVSYRQDRTDASTNRRIGYLMKGPLGQEAEQSPSVIDRDLLQARPVGERNRIEPGDCDFYHDVGMRDRTWVTDADRQYRLDFGPKQGGQEPHSIALMRADGSGRVDLPVNSTEVFALCTHFHRFDEAFLIWDCLNAGSNQESMKKWRQTNCVPVWRVEPPQGHTQRICVPFGEWASVIELVPTKIGLLFRSSAASPKNPRDPGAAGLYRLRDGTAQRILPGIIFDPVVSPSGCKVVMAYAPAAADSRSIIATDLCSAK